RDQPAPALVREKGAWILEAPQRPPGVLREHPARLLDVLREPFDRLGRVLPRAPARLQDRRLEVHHREALAVPASVPGRRGVHVAQEYALLLERTGQAARAAAVHAE